MLLAIVSNGLVLYGSSVYSVPVHAQKISRGSVATCLRMDGIFNYHLLLSLSVREYWKWVNI